MPRTISDSSILSNCYGHRKASETFVTPKVDKIRLKNDKTYRPPLLNSDLAHFGERIDKEDFTILSNLPTQEKEPYKSNAVRVGVGLSRSDPNAPRPPPLLDLDFSEKQDDDDFVGSFNKLAQGVDDDFIEESIAFYDNFGERRPDKLKFRDDDVDELKEVLQKSLETEREDRIIRGDEDLELAISQSQFQPEVQSQIVEQPQGSSEVEIRETEQAIPQAPSQLMTRESIRPEQEMEQGDDFTQEELEEELEMKGEDIRGLVIRERETMLKNIDRVIDKLKPKNQEISRELYNQLETAVEQGLLNEGDLVLTGQKFIDALRQKTNININEEDFDLPKKAEEPEPLPKQAKKKSRGRPKEFESVGFTYQQDREKRQARREARRTRGEEDDDEFTNPLRATGVYSKKTKIPIEPPAFRRKDKLKFIEKYGKGSISKPKGSMAEEM